MVTVMNKTIIPVIALSFVCVGAASANDRVSDAQYIAMARCVGIAQALDQDGDAWAQRQREARAGRSVLVQDRADAEESRARRSVRRADDRHKAELAEELQDRCAALASAG